MSITSNNKCLCLTCKGVFNYSELKEKELKGGLVKNIIKVCPECNARVTCIDPRVVGYCNKSLNVNDDKRYLNSK